MVQTLQQRKANQKFAQREEKKKGQPASSLKRGEKTKSPISPFWLAILAFIVFGGLVFEFVRLVWGRFA